MAAERITININNNNSPIPNPNVSENSQVLRAFWKANLISSQTQCNFILVQLKLDMKR